MTENTGAAPLPPARRPGGPRRWGLLGAIVAVSAGAYVVLMAGGDRPGPGADRAAAVMLGPAEMAGATGGKPESYQRTNPPVDLAMVERAARGATLGRVPLPDSRELVTYYDGTTGAAVTQAVLLYDDAAQAANLDALASPLLSSSFGLDATPIKLDGTTDARRWTAATYQAVTFRVDGAIAFVGTTDTRDPDQVLRLAEALRDRARAAVATAASAAGPATPAPTPP